MYRSVASRRKTLLGQILENILMDLSYHLGTAFELEKIDLFSLGNTNLVRSGKLSMKSKHTVHRKKAPIYKCTFQISSLYHKKVFLCLILLDTKLLSFDKENLFGKCFYKSEFFSLIVHSCFQMINCVRKRDVNCHNGKYEV